MISSFDYFVKWLLLRVICFNGMAFLGILLIGFGLWAPASTPLTAELERLATFIGSLVTLLGVCATAASIYFYKFKPTSPSPESYWAAPIMIGACVFAIAYLFLTHSLSSHVVNGFALLGLAGALLRLQPNPQRAATSD